LADGKIEEKSTPEQRLGLDGGDDEHGEKLRPKRTPVMHARWARGLGAAMRNLDRRRAALARRKQPVRGADCGRTMCFSHGHPERGFRVSAGHLAHGVQVRLASMMMAIRRGFMRSILFGEESKPK